MKTIKKICVYCGARDAVDEKFLTAAYNFGALMAKSDKDLVYGGGSTGLMGAVTNGALSGGSHVTGIIPSHLSDIEKLHPDVQDTIVVETMHERKQRMADLSDAFVVMPGGFGTMDEFFEILTWKQLGLHDKPIIIVNIDGYWNAVLELIDTIIAMGSALAEHRNLFVITDSIEKVLPILADQPDSSHPTRIDLA